MFPGACHGLSPSPDQTKLQYLIKLVSHTHTKKCWTLFRSADAKTKEDSLGQRMKTICYLASSGRAV